MKMENINSSSKETGENNFQIIDLDLEDGASIFFAPTGEQWRISTDDKGRVTFERLPGNTG